MIDRVVQGFHRFQIILLNRFYYAVTDVVFHNHLAGIIDSIADCRQLDQHFRAVLIPLHHPSDRFEMADRPGKPVEDSLFLLRAVHMMMGVTAAVAATVEKSWPGILRAAVR